MRRPRHARRPVNYAVDVAAQPLDRAEDVETLGQVVLQRSIVQPDFDHLGLLPGRAQQATKRLGRYRIGQDRDLVPNRVQRATKDDRPYGAIVFTYGHVLGHGGAADQQHPARRPIELPRRGFDQGHTRRLAGHQEHRPLAAAG